jgi:hypothetical protein
MLFHEFRVFFQAPGYSEGRFTTPELVLMKTTLLFFYLVITAACAHAQSVIVTASLPSGAVHTDVRVTGSIEGSSTQYQCQSTPARGFPDPKLQAFACPNMQYGKYAATFVFEATGYQPHTIRVGNFTRPQGWAFPLGVVVLTDSNEPRIDGVQVITTPDNIMQIVVTINNLSARQLNVTALKMDASYSYGCLGGMKDQNNHYLVKPKPHVPIHKIINDRLLLKPYDGANAGVSVLIAPATDHPEYPLQASGEFDDPGCARDFFHLTLPITATIAARQSYEVRLLAPFVNNMMTGTDGIAIRPLLDRFHHVSNTLVTTDRDTPELFYKY